MKTQIKNLLVLPVLVAGLGLMLTGPVTAQVFRTLHFFDAADGASPDAGLILSGNTLYGTANTVFAVNANGTGFTILHGSNALNGLILSGNTLYGTASQVGGGGSGEVFAISTNGTGFTNLYSFTAAYNTNSDGTYPNGLILSGSTLYGTAGGGGRYGNGTVFALSTNGTGFTNLHSLSAGVGSFPYITNSDGIWPAAGLILSGNTLYGTASRGGSWGNGTVFAVNTNGTGFTTLHHFTALDPNRGNSDGANPEARLILSGNMLYGTAAYGGSSGNGTVFGLRTDGTGFTNLHSFTANPYVTNSDGAGPHDGLILSGNTLYGTASFCGGSGYGTVFALNTNGTRFTVLYSFNDLSDGAYPHAGLLLSGNTLYGTAVEDSQGLGYGTVFSLSLPLPKLTIVPSGRNVILSWPTNSGVFDDTGYILQSTTNLVSSAVWTTVSPPPVAVNGLNTVTNPISGRQKFYRLSQ